MKKPGKRSKIFTIQNMSLLIALVVSLVIGFLSRGNVFPPLDGVERSIRDQDFLYKELSRNRQQLQEGVSVTTAQPNARVSENITIVALDEASLAELGRWPWPRSVQARVMQAAARISHEPNRERAMFIDFFYFDKGQNPNDDQILEDSIRENGRIFIETVPDHNDKKDDQSFKDMYDLQDALFKRFGTITKVTGAWRNVEGFQNDQVPLTRFAKAARGYGNAIHALDPDGFCRWASLVNRFSRISRSVDIPGNAGGLRNAVLGLTTDASRFEWIGWTSEDETVNAIDLDRLHDAEYVDRLVRDMEQKALRVERDSAHPLIRLKYFTDYFTPAIALSLALEYYHKTLADVEVKYGEYIRISQPEEYVYTGGDAVYPEGSWRKLMRNGQPVEEIKIPINDQGRMRINYMGSSSVYSNTYNVQSFLRFADPARIPERKARPEDMPPFQNLQNKLVFVCAYATGLGDEKQTPFGLMYGGEIHANALNTILKENYIIEPPLLATLGIIIFLVFLTAFVSSRCSPLLSLAITIWHAVVYYLLVIQLFDTNNIMLNFSAPSIGMLFTFLVIVAYRVIFEEQDKRRIKGMFSKYVNPQVVEQLLVNPPELGGVDKEITVLFSDIRGYTTFSETMTPQALVNHLNIYLTEMTNILIEYHGTLDKYVGDMVMGFWGAPMPQKNHALLACKCALRQMTALKILNEGWPREKRIDIGIGINSGIMTVGNMGSPARMNYTLIGDNVNLGSRLEGTNKGYGTNIIISEYTYGLVRDQVVVRELDNIRVKGKNKPVLIYELVDVVDGLDPPKASAVY
jgi:adenylate cyclase